MNNDRVTIPQETQRRSVAPLTVFLAVIMSFFCAILVFVFIVTKQINPVMLDQQGRPLGQQTSQ